MNVLEIGKRFGLDTGALAQGMTLDVAVPIATVGEFRDLFASDLSDEERQAFSDGSRKVVTDEPPAMVQLVDHVFGAGELTPEAAAHADKLFPVKVQLTLGQTVIFDTDKTVGPSASPYGVIADVVIFKGGSLTIKSTALTVRAGTLLIGDSQGSKMTYHLGVFGIDGKVGDVGGDGPIYADSGANGADRSPASPGNCIAVPDGGNAPAALKGQTGHAGLSGKPGSASLPATIIISAFDPASAGAFIVQTRSAAGGAGGAGGKGGAGQKGGRGGNGCNSGCEGSNGGDGAAGGAGGDGGLGGNGVDGINGYPIGITFPNKYKLSLQTISQQAPAGDGGPGGGPGSPGTPGNAGSGGKGRKDGQKGGGSASGSPGANGKPGTNPGQPGQITPNFV